VTFASDEETFSSVLSVKLSTEAAMDTCEAYPNGWFGIYGTTNFPDWCYGKNSSLRIGYY